ncbi:hypothetical protein P7C70_g3221, partial [Phenoliferia sp. Uapishka_3]
MYFRLKNLHPVVNVEFWDTLRAETRTQDARIAQERDERLAAAAAHKEGNEAVRKAKAAAKRDATKARKAKKKEELDEDLSNHDWEEIAEAEELAQRAQDLIDASMRDALEGGDIAEALGDLGLGALRVSRTLATSRKRRRPMFRPATYPPLHPLAQTTTTGPFSDIAKPTTVIAAAGDGSNKVRLSFHANGQQSPTISPTPSPAPFPPFSPVNLTRHLSSEPSAGQCKGNGKKKAPPYEYHAVRKRWKNGIWRTWEEAGQRALEGGVYSVDDGISWTGNESTGHEDKEENVKPDISLLQAAVIVSPDATRFLRKTAAELMEYQDDEY